MQINCTVLIQIINFWATYFFLRKILLSPIIELINRKKSAKSALNANLREKEDFIHELVNKKSKELTDFAQQVQFRYKTPQIIHAEIKADLIYVPDNKKIDALISSSKNLIIEKISNAL
jgi:chemotaxis protein CheY-P-specific phosphatase CheC